ncbi:hypothetical protein FH972_027333 [Carpinus fangiana]|uniref:Legume lectin domain-containing protein n=1 Tax=Carpinus fangiana TaxID=176857 RepID=A0A5N6Q7D0_9ROSI|nr:hypothetical protein FH972_027333 [Carpinus fangiana]
MLESNASHDAGYWPDNSSDADDDKSFKELKLNSGENYQDEMYVEFTSATGQLVESHKILAWSFSNSNFLLSQELVTTGLPSFVLPKGSIFRSKGGSEGEYMLGREEMEEWESEYWPHRMTYVEIEAATRDFSEENMIGSGGNGKVYNDRI